MQRQPRFVTSVDRASIIGARKTNEDRVVSSVPARLAAPLDAHGNSYWEMSGLMIDGHSGSLAADYAEKWVLELLHHRMSAVLAEDGLGNYERVLEALRLFNADLIGETCIFPSPGAAVDFEGSGAVLAFELLLPSTGTVYAFVLGDAQYGIFDKATGKPLVADMRRVDLQRRLDAVDFEVLVRHGPAITAPAQAGGPILRCTHGDLAALNTAEAPPPSKVVTFDDEATRLKCAPEAVFKAYQSKQDKTRHGPMWQVWKAAHLSQVTEATPLSMVLMDFPPEMGIERRTDKWGGYDERNRASDTLPSGAVSLEDEAKRLGCTKAEVASKHECAADEPDPTTGLRQGECWRQWRRWLMDNEHANPGEMLCYPMHFSGGWRFPGGLQPAGAVHNGGRRCVRNAEVYVWRMGDELSQVERALWTDGVTDSGAIEEQRLGELRNDLKTFEHNFWDGHLALEGARYVQCNRRGYQFVANDAAAMRAFRREEKVPPEEAPMVAKVRWLCTELRRGGLLDYLDDEYRAAVTEACAHWDGRGPIEAGERASAEDVVHCAASRMSSDNASVLFMRQEVVAVEPQQQQARPHGLGRRQPA